MKRLKLLTAFLLINLTFHLNPVFSQETHPNPKVIYMTTPQGEKLFQESKYKADFWRLAPYYESQEKTNTCGVASSVIALNALGVNGPDRLGEWNQSDFFTNKVQQVVSPENVDLRGMSMDEIQQALETFDVNATVYYWDENNPEKMREMLKEALQDPNKVVLVNFYRPALGLSGAGHYSPVAAYDQKADAVLVMDVANDKPPPTWMDMNALLASMQTQSGKSRGFVVVSRDA